MDQARERHEWSQISCLRCQRRKVKCDRQSPYGECIRSKQQCVPSTRKPRAKRATQVKNTVELRQRVAKLEQLINHLPSRQGARDAGASPFGTALPPVETHADMRSPASSTVDEGTTKSMLSDNELDRPMTGLTKQYLGGAFLGVADRRGERTS